MLMGSDPRNVSYGCSCFAQREATSCQEMYRRLFFSGHRSFLPIFKHWVTTRIGAVRGHTSSPGNSRLRLMTVFSSTSKVPAMQSFTKLTDWVSSSSCGAMRAGGRAGRTSFRGRFSEWNALDSFFTIRGPVSQQSMILTSKEI